MHYFRILGLNFERVFEYRSHSLVWFILALINPLIILMFWHGSAQDNSMVSQALPDLTSYYFLLIIANTFIISHSEGDVSIYDIKLGGLIKYLLRPFPYYLAKFIEEFPYRVLQGIFGIITFIILTVFFGSLMKISSSAPVLLMSFPIIILAYFLSFTFKMILGILAFWLTDVWGIFDTAYVTTVVFSGTVLPLTFMPDWLNKISTFLPFSYMIYFPISSVQGQFSLMEMVRILLNQGIWLFILAMIYKIMWREGVKKFTAVGQ